MADENYLTKFPTISVPKDIKEEDGVLSFEIKTCKGLIEIASRRWRRNFWRCHGDVPSLVAGDFIQPDWCPGLPGNNKTRQTVIFENDIPQLIYGNRRGTVLHHPYIVIIRISKNKFEIEIPATEGQHELIEQACERWRNEKPLRKQQEELKRKEQTRKQKSDNYSHPDYFKDRAIFFLDVGLEASMRELRGEHELSNYGEKTIWIDEQSAQDILCAGERLIEEVRKAKIICRRRKPHLSIVNSNVTL